MINIRTIKKLTNNDGLTLKNGKVISYRTGWQVATHGVEVKTAKEAIEAVKAYDGNCGIWLENGIYYVDKSFRVSAKLSQSAGHTIRFPSLDGEEKILLTAKKIENRG